MKWWIILGILGMLSLGILTTVLYFVLGSGDSQGNTVNLNNNKKDEGDKQTDTNIIQQTSQGGVHILECTGQLHINWKILLSLSILILLVLIVKWSVQYNICKVIKCKRFSQTKNKKGEKEKQRVNDEGENLNLVERRQTMEKRGQT